MPKLNWLETHGVVYFLETDDSQFVKIGFSRRVHGRLLELDTNRPSTFKFKIIGAIPGSRHVETWLHRLFAKDCDNGEWFRSTPRLRTLINILELDPHIDPNPPKRPYRHKPLPIRYNLLVVPKAAEPRAQWAVKCQQCGKYWIPRTPDGEHVCPNCGAAVWTNTEQRAIPRRPNPPTD